MTAPTPWFPLDTLPPTAASRTRCTWHGDRANPCRIPPVTGVHTRDGARWSACPEAARTVAAARGVPLPG